MKPTTNTIPNPPPEAEDDISLMLRVQEGDLVAFSRLSGRYRTRLRRFFEIVLPDSTQAEDMTQETLLRLWLARTDYRPTGNFRAYLFGIGRHQFLNHRQRQSDRLRREPPEDIDLAHRFAAPEDDEPETATMNRWEQEKRRKAITMLPPAYRIVFTLNHFDGLTYAEIADHLQIPLGTVKSRMAEAVRRLRLTLKGRTTDE